MNLNFEKMGGLVPAIIQDARTKNVLMLGFMNKEAFENSGYGLSDILQPHTQLLVDKR